MNLINALLDNTFGEEAREQLLNGRYADRRGFMNDTNVLKGLAKIARQLNDVAPIVEGDPSKLASMHDRIAEIEGMMGNRNSEYYKGPQADALQKELRELYDLRSKHEQAA